MKMITVEKFCCCCELEKGTKIISILGIIGGILSFIYALIPHNMPENEWFHQIVAVEVISSVINIITYTLLAMGAYQKKARLVFIYLFITLILAVLGSAFVIYVLVVSFTYSAGIGFGVLTYCIIFYAIAAYIWICIYSYYKQLEMHLPYIN